MNDSDLIAGFFASIATYSKVSLTNRKSHVKLFQEAMQPKSLLELTKTDVAIYAQKCLNRGLLDISVKRYLSTIQLFFEYAYEEDAYPLKEFKRIQKYVKQFSFEKGAIKTRLSTKEVLLLFKKAAFNKTFTFACWFIINFGVRASELLNLNISDFDFNEKLITIRKGKGKKTRRIPIRDIQIPDLLQWFEVRESMLSLGSTEKSFLIVPRTEASPSYEWLCKKFKKITDETDIHFHAHRLRRTCACIMFYDLGASIDTVSFILGHSSIATTQEYLGITEQDKIDRFREQLKDKKMIPEEIVA